MKIFAYIIERIPGSVVRNIKVCISSVEDCFKMSRGFSIVQSHIIVLFVFSSLLVRVGVYECMSHAMYSCVPAGGGHLLPPFFIFFLTPLFTHSPRHTKQLTIGPTLKSEDTFDSDWMLHHCTWQDRTCDPIIIAQTCQKVARWSQKTILTTKMSYSILERSKIY